MTFAEVAVDTYQDPTKRLFTYLVPENLAVKEGQKVAVPFGKRTVRGYIWKLTQKKPPFQTKEIIGLEGQGFKEAQIKLARWMVEHYLASPLDCLKCQIPGKGERVALGPLDRITTLILIPYASQVRLRATTLASSKVLIGSRSAVFAQLPNLQKIIIEEPENWNYKDERSPYYHVKDIAKKRAELENLELELHYQVPRVEDVYIEKLKLPKLEPAMIIDLNREKASGNFTFVSQALADTVLRNKITPERSEESTFISQPLEAQIKANKHTLVYVNSRELREKIGDGLLKIGADKNFVEILGPELFGLAGKEVENIFWTDVDTLLNLPDFRAHEKIVWTVHKLGRLARDRVYLQTSSPDYPLFRELETGNLATFYQRELENRREFSFPPFSTLVKLTFAAKGSTKANFEAEKLYEKLSEISDQRSGLQVSPPYQPYSATPGRFQLNIALKMKKTSGLAKLSPLIPPGWRVEVDPESLL